MGEFKVYQEEVMVWEKLVGESLEDQFYKDVASLITGYSARPKFLPWVDLTKLSWSRLSLNPEAIELLTANQDKINWEMLSGNIGAIDLLTANQNKISWDWLSSNPEAIELLTANQDKIHWLMLSSNPGAIDLLTANQDKIDWRELSRNKAIFYFFLIVSSPNFQFTN
jgi:hypothetical protein